MTLLGTPTTAVKFDADDVSTWPSKVISSCRFCCAKCDNAMVKGAAFCDKQSWDRDAMFAWMSANPRR